jgi:putative acetyltransferase
VNITEGGLDEPDVIALLGEHLQGMADHSPPESVHALGIEQLKAPDITFWTIREGVELLGCIALKHLDDGHGEIKSMRTSSSHLRRGVAAELLRHAIDEGRRRSYDRLSLETGSGPGFEAAGALFSKLGFVDCGPFADYREDPFSRFMTLELR